MQMVHWIDMFNMITPALTKKRIGCQPPPAGKLGVTMRLYAPGLRHSTDAGIHQRLSGLSKSGLAKIIKLGNEETIHKSPMEAQVRS